MKSIGYVVAGALVWSLAGVAAAQSNTAGLDQRQANQARRIDQGRQNGIDSTALAGIERAKAVP